MIGFVELLASSDEVRCKSERSCCARKAIFVSFTILFPVGYGRKCHGARKSWTIEGAFELLMFQYLCACRWGCEEGKTAHAWVSSFKFAPTTHYIYVYICETGMRGYVPGGSVSIIDVAWLGWPTWPGKITNEEEDH